MQALFLGSLQPQNLAPRPLLAMLWYEQHSGQGLRRSRKDTMRGLGCRSRVNKPWTPDSLFDCLHLSPPLDAR